MESTIKKTANIIQVWRAKYVLKEMRLGIGGDLYGRILQLDGKISRIEAK